MREALHRLAKLATLGLLFCLNVNTADARIDDWIELKSANFVVYSDVGEEVARALITDLEYFRYFLQFVTNVPTTEGPTPLTVYALQDASDFKRIVQTRAIGLYVDQGVDQKVGPPVAFVKLDKRTLWFGSDGRDTLFHEYVHHFLNQFSPFRYPLWYDEGFAEFLSSFSYENGVVWVGKVVESNEFALSQTWMPISKLVSTKREYPTGPGSGAFYSQSWLLVHYLQSNPELKSSLVNYLRAVNMGQDLLDAYNSSFEMKPAELWKALRGYRHGGSIPSVQYKLTEEPPPPPIVIRSVPEPEADYLVMLEHSRFMKPRYHLRTVRRAMKKIIKKWPEFPLSYLFVAEEEFDHGSREEGRRLLNDFLARIPEHSGALGLAAHFEFEIALAMESGPERDVQCEAALDSLRAALSADPSNVRALYELGHLGLLTDEVEMLGSLKAMRDARLLIPSNERIQMYFALLAAKAGYEPQARELLTDLVDWSRNDEIVEEAGGHLTRLAGPVAE